MDPQAEPGPCMPRLYLPRDIKQSCLCGAMKRYPRIWKAFAYRLLVVANHGKQEIHSPLRCMTLLEWVDPHEIR